MMGRILIGSTAVTLCVKVNDHTSHKDKQLGESCKDSKKKGSTPSKVPIDDLSQHKKPFGRSINPIVIPAEC